MDHVAEMPAEPPSGFAPLFRSSPLLDVLGPFWGRGGGPIW